MLRLLFQPLRIDSTFVALIVVTTNPWMVIMMLGYVQRRGYYLPDAMQVFNRGQTGGPYWFYRGWNLAGVSAWIVSSLVALLTVNIPGHFVGWLGNVAGGIDVSLTAALILPTLLYPIVYACSRNRTPFTVLPAHS